MRSPPELASTLLQVVETLPRVAIPTTDIASWTAFGYHGTVASPAAEISGDAGANFNFIRINTALASIVDQTVLLPVASTWQADGGNNANFAAVGLVSATICGA